MGLINRISRLFTADFNAVLDRIEEPEQLVKQAIRDMEDEIAASEAHLKLCVHDQQVLGVRRTELDENLAELDSELDLCLSTGKEDLARSLVKKKLEAQRLQKRLTAKHVANKTFLTDQDAKLTENRATLAGLKQKAEIFAETRPADDGPASSDLAWLTPEVAVTDDEIEVALLREKQARNVS